MDGVRKLVLRATHHLFIFGYFRNELLLQLNNNEKPKLNAIILLTSYLRILQVRKGTGPRWFA